MKNLFQTINIILIILAVLCLSTSQFANQQTKYTLTIFVDEGRGKLTGHVFILLSDGKNEIYRGFYPNEVLEELEAMGGIPGPLFMIAGGEIRDDSKVVTEFGKAPNLHHWDVKRTYNISREGFNRALEGMEAVKTQGDKWWLTQHCGEFAEAIAKVAGVNLELPGFIGLRNRPKVFGEYLRQHGGIINEESDSRSDSISNNSDELVYDEKWRDCRDLWLEKESKCVDKIVKLALEGKIGVLDGESQRRIDDCAKEREKGFEDCDKKARRR
jgi:hypothetical protein